MPVAKRTEQVQQATQPTGLVPYWRSECGRAVVYVGDNLKVMAQMEADQFHAVVTDPPYGIEFMGRDWDAPWKNGTVDARSHRATELLDPVKAKYLRHGVEYGRDSVMFQQWFWERAVEIMRVAKPGAHLLSFGGTRMWHRMACAVEDAGWEIRDTIMWVYGSGFPKSMNIEKQLSKICNPIDNDERSIIIQAWKNYSKNARPVGQPFQKNTTETGTNTQRNGSVLGSAALQISLKKSNANAILAELNSTEAHHTQDHQERTAPQNVEETELQSHARHAVNQRQNESQRQYTDIGIAQLDVVDWQNENTEEITKAVEVLKTWLGRKRSSEREDISALCAELTNALKRIMLSRSKTFQSLDMMCQMDFVSATTVITTEFMEDSLILFMEDTLKRERSERKVRQSTDRRNDGTVYGLGHSGCVTVSESTNAVAQKWSGWGTALKPSLEPVVVARKPFKGSVAQNVLEHGCGGINVDACRVGTDQVGWNGANGFTNTHQASVVGGLDSGEPRPVAGRWPANLIHDGSDEVVELFPSGAKPKATRTAKRGGTAWHGQDGFGSPDGIGTWPADEGGSAARFFYTAKADANDRPHGKGATTHPTVKPLDLMRYLVRLVCAPGGTVLDPFMGSGSTGCAAVTEGIKFVGIEQSREYADIAVGRLKLALLEKDGAAGASSGAPPVEVVD